MFEIWLSCNARLLKWKQHLFLNAYNRVCCALCKRIRLHSAQHTRHTGHTMPP